MQLGGAGMLRVDLPAEPLGVVFDAEHLRRVLVNLLDNARRHASGKPGAVLRPARAVAGRRQARVFGVAERRRADRRRRRARICSSRFSRRAAAAPVWAFTFAASSVNDTGLASTTGCCRREEPRRNEFYVDMRRGGRPAADRSGDASPHDHRLALQPARRRRRARPAHALRADASARGLRHRHRRHRRRKRCCT